MPSSRSLIPYVAYRLLGGALIFLMAASTLPAQTYRLAWPEAASHTLSVEIEVVPEADARSTEFQMPTWRPGRYIRQDYASAVWAAEAESSTGDPLPVEKAGPSTWRVTHAAGLEAIRLRYLGA